jgi:DNA primase
MNLIQKIASKLGAYTVRKNGEEFTYACPRCHHVKLEINPGKKLFHCFRCNYKGTLGQILKDLNIAPGIVLVVHSIEKPAVIETQEFKIPGYECGGLNAETIKFCQGRGLSLRTFLESRWGISHDRQLKNRLIIPIIEDKVIVSYVARATNGSQPKELSGPNRSWHLYNIDEVKRDEPVVLVEGIFDCEAVRRAGFIACAIMGSSISDTQVGKLLAKAPSKIILMLDGDRAGLEGTVKAYKKLLKRTHTPVAPLLLRDWDERIDKDPDEIPTELLKELICAAVEAYQPR